MCRWLAYNGPPIFLDTILFKPENSLIQQSLRALQSRSVTNGDGFGVGWYGARQEPGVYRDKRPAWNDEDLRSLSEQISAGLFLAHVRASTGTATARANCHPFRHGKWLFMHNGSIGGFERIRRELVLQLRPDLFCCVQGATDSELFFHLLIGEGMEDDVDGALSRTVARIEAVMTENAIAAPLTLTAALSDGEVIHAVRYASNNQPPTLYYGAGVTLQEIAVDAANPMAQAMLVVSEPIDGALESWTAVPPSHLVTAGNEGITVRPFAPKAG